MVAVGWIDGGETTGEFTESVTKLAAYEAAYGRLDDVLRIKSGPQMCEGRNGIVERFLEINSEWLFMVDTDMVFGYNVAERLIASAVEANVKMMGGLCFGIDKQLGQFPTLYRDVSGHPTVMLDLPDSGVVEVDGTGAAFIVTHRSVFVDNRRDGHHPWFHRIEVAESNTNPGNVLSEDLSWCWWLKSRGVKICVDVDVEAGHVKPSIVGRATYRRPGKQLEIVRGKG